MPDTPKPSEAIAPDIYEFEVVVPMRRKFRVAGTSQSAAAELLAHTLQMGSTQSYRFQVWGPLMGGAMVPVDMVAGGFQIESATKVEKA